MRSKAVQKGVVVVPYPTIEVYISSIAGTDSFRQADVIMPVAKSAVVGFGWRGYLLALEGLVGTLEDGGKK